MTPELIRILDQLAALDELDLVETLADLSPEQSEALLQVMKDCRREIPCVKRGN